ncbi:MAG: DUF1292 domain-containing protein [Firmicutes bacterium]|nr:DUF1292 domain-containing protein [Bacillota bacterium]
MMECKVLMTFDREETGKSYIVYAARDKEGRPMIMANYYDTENRLMNIETAEEWEVIDQFLKQLLFERSMKNG